MQFRLVYPRQFKTQKSRFFMLLFSLFFILKSYAGVNYAEGLVPSIAIDSATRTIVETHVGDEAGDVNTNVAPYGKLWLKVGAIDANNNIDWKTEIQYEDGGHPKVASLGEGRFVEVHEDQYQDKNTGDYQIWVTYGTVSNNIFNKNTPYGASNIRGQRPSVAYLGNNKVIVVYSRNDNGHPWRSLYYTIYQLDDNNQFKPIDGATNVQYETSGTTPSIAMLGNTIVETHIGDPAPYTNSLFSKVGRFDDSSNTISWNPSSYYTNTHPSGNYSIIKIGDNAIAETHFGDGTVSDPDTEFLNIYSVTGTLSSDGKSINWANNYQIFDSGSLHSGNALAALGSKLFEVHTQPRGSEKCDSYDHCIWSLDTIHMYIDTGSITQDSSGNYNINWGLNSSKNLRSNQEKGRASILPW